jgi:DNA repair protein RadD
MSTTDAAGQLCLRPYQVEAVHEVNRRILSGARRVLLVASTGAGKTLTAAHMIRAAFERGERSLFVAHRREIIQQSYTKLIEYGVPECEVGIIMASDVRRKPGAAVQVASIDTLRRRSKPVAHWIFHDEAHRICAKSNQALVAHYDRAVHIGLTATPYRADGRGLGEVFDDLVVVASMRRLIDEGFLVEPKVFSTPALPDLSHVRLKGADYDERALAHAVDQKALVGNIVEHWQKLARGTRTVVFATSVGHSKHITERFRAAGIAAEHLDGTTPVGERDAILARLERGVTRVVSNCQCLAEGWDQPSVKCAVLARPTKSTGLYLQQAGRILRPFEGQGAVILDHAGCALAHGLPQDDRLFHLDGLTAEDAEAAICRTCPSCYAIIPIARRTCPECGTDLPVRTVIPKETSDALVEMSGAQRGPEPERVYLEQLRALARAQRRDDAWVSERYVARYRRLPPPEWLASSWCGP